MDVGQVLGSLGLQTGLPSANTSHFVAPQPAAPKAPGFFSNLGHSLATVPLQVASGLASPIIKGFQDVSGGISEALTSGAQNSANQRYQQALNDAGNTYHHLYTSGKMTKAAYTKATQGIIKQSQSLSNNISQDTSQMVSPGDFLKGAAVVGSLPFAAGGAEAIPGISQAAEAPGIIGAAGKVGQLAERAIGVKPGAQVLSGPDFVAGENGVRAATAADKTLPVSVRPSTVKTALAAPAKATLVTAPVAQSAAQTAIDLKHGNLAGAAGNAAMLAAPAAVIKGAKLAAPILKDAAFGVKSTLGDVFGNKRLAQFMQTATPQQLNSLKRMEMFTENQRTDNPSAFLTNHYQTELGTNPRTADIGQAVKRFDEYANTHGILSQSKADTAKAAEDVIAHNKMARAEARATNAAAEAKAPAASPIPAAVDQALSKSPSRVLPKEIAGAKPNYNYGSKGYSLNFKDGVTKALYIVAGKNPSKSEGAYLDFLRQHFPGESDAQIKARGAQVRSSIKDMAAKGDGGQLTVEQHPAATNGLQEKVNQAVATAKTAPPLTSEPVPKVKANVLPVPKAIPSEAVVSHDFRDAIPAAKDALSHLSPTASEADRQVAVNNALDALGIRNKSVGDKIGAALIDAPKGEEANALDKIVQKNVINHPSLKLPKGFIATYGPKEVADLPSKTAARLAGDVNVGKDANPILGGAVKALQSKGLGIQGTSPVDTGVALRTNLQDNLHAAGIHTDINDVMGALHSVTKAGVSDPRMLTKNELDGALTGVIDRSQRGAVRGAILKAYADLPKELVGAGPAALNKVIQRAPWMAKYMRLETAGRYEVPVLSLPFRAKQLIKGAFVAGAEGANTLKVDPETMQELESAGKLSASTRAGSDATLSDQLASNGNVKPLNREQQFIKGTLAQSVVNATGRSLKDIRAENGPLWRELSGSLDLVTGYGRGGYLNSPFAKTMNLLLFPSRFETKVAMETGKYMSKLSPVSQAGVVQSVANAKQFMDSPQGQKWQKDNSELLGLVKYLTPLSTLDNVSKFVHNGGHVSDLGEIGGLPVGVLTSMLEHQGVNLGKIGSSQYVDPKTGQPVPDKIPQTVKARMQQGFADLLSSMFAYPGRTAGLPSKTNVVQLGGKNPLTTPAKTDVKPQLKGDYSGSPADAAVASVQRPSIPPSQRIAPPVSAKTPAPIYKASSRAPKVKTLAKKLIPY